MKSFDAQRPELDRFIAAQVEISLKYEGYIKRQLKQIEEFTRMEERPLPPDLDYCQIKGLGRIRLSFSLASRRSPGIWQ